MENEVKVKVNMEVKARSFIVHVRDVSPAEIRSMSTYADTLM